MMIGGDAADVEFLKPFIIDACIPDGYAHVGPNGAGHYVKMVHNGIEYGMMQAIGEGFALMKQAPEFKLDLKAITDVYNHGSVIESRLVGWLGKAYREYGEDLSEISGEVSASGEGLWTVEAAKRSNLSVEIIEKSLKFREDSKGNPSYTGQVVSALRNQFGGHDVKVKN
jgi:6-phosphogluconate dehydrogenase